MRQTFVRPTQSNGTSGVEPVTVDGVRSNSCGTRVYGRHRSACSISSRTPKPVPGNICIIYAHNRAAFIMCTTPTTFRTMDSVLSLSCMVSSALYFCLIASEAELNIKPARTASRMVMRILKAARNMTRGPFWGCDEEPFWFFGKFSETSISDVFLQVVSIHRIPDHPPNILRHRNTGSIRSVLDKAPHFVIQAQLYGLLLWVCCGTASTVRVHGK